MSRVVVVTGGASGIGLGVVERFAADGHQVAAWDIQPEAVQKVAADLGVLGQVVDVGDRAAVEAAFDVVRAELGPIEIVITCAGVDVSGPFAELTQDAWDRAIRVNLTGTFNCTQPVVAEMIAAGWGRIVTISSSSAQSGAPDRPAYVASKGGVIAFTKALAVDLSPHGITANTIPPSIVDTPMAQAGVATGVIPPLDVIKDFIPIRRASTPADIAGTCAFLCSDEGSSITGQTIGVNGGMYM
ncbi:SDR family NAD(P)-dependent oxidoreductase [Aquihabitans sp. McL0605]|uniref:SDR family NAD(P)-dependent oxidoreductase n=1 Tax=Aquihabitans sp. McL0605 TaxID=3415671 RepID=UPI003CEA6A7C